MTVSGASRLFPCPQEGCSSSFQSFESLQRHLNYGQHENKPSQESVYDQLRRDSVGLPLFFPKTALELNKRIISDL